MNSLAFSMLMMMTFAMPVCGQFAADRPGGHPAAGGGAAMNNMPDLPAPVLRDLLEARELVKRMPVTPLRERLDLLLARSEAQVKAMLSQNGGGVGGMELGKPQAISPEDFNRLSVSLRSQAFDKDKYQFLETYAAGRKFTCEQAATLVKYFSFDPDRIRAVVLIHPSIIDPNNFHLVLNAFMFDTSKRTVLERLQKKEGWKP